ncbi:hypothetical protein BASA83_006389 [Batrachochytrium salamandrivorans]|nr:hypothetical protein BASA83_006389 [Batrachochytrium salamandrivorans]
MVVVSLFLVLALVSSTVVAQPGIKGLTSLFSCSKPLETSEISTKIVYEWIPPRRWGPTPASNGDPVEIGLKYILQKLKLRSNEFMVMKNFTDHSESTHMYGVPLHEGLPIENLHAAAHIKKGRVFFYSATIGIKKKLTKRSPTTSKSRAVKSSKEAVNAAVNAWAFPSTVMLHLTTQQSPEDGFSTIIDPENIQSSPKGWTEGYKLAGNMLRFVLRETRDLERLPKAYSAGALIPHLSPETPKNMVAGAANAFYVTNTFHDTLYQYGFTESAGNFQQKNFGKGGKDGDSIFIDIQGSDKEDEAFFLTPPDGQYGVLYLHLYTATKPNRDPALDNTMLTHELTHGLSNRLTGGAHEGMCMEDVQSEGLNEGYSDMVSLIFTAKPEDARNTRRVIGGYVEGNLRGLR